MKIGELSKRLGLSVSTVRFWSTDEDYRKHLSEQAIGGSGATRIYSEQDALIVATIQKLRDQGLSKEQILEALDAEKLIEDLPEAPDEEAEQARKRVSLIPVGQLERALDQLKLKQEELDIVRDERDSILQKLTDQDEKHSEEVSKLNERISKLSMEIGRARGLLIGAAAVAIILSLFLIATIILMLQYLPAS